MIRLQPNRVGKEDPTEEVAIDRRGYLKLAGVAVGSATTVTAVSGTAAAATQGYGSNGYGAGDYGESSTEEPTGGTAPTIDTLRVTESSPPNPHAELTLWWVVSDPDGDLSTVDISIFDERRQVESETISVDGERASDTTHLTIKKGAGQTFDVVVSVSDSTGRTAEMTESVSA